MGRYGIKEIERVVHGEGAFAGRSVVRVSFSGCNLWDGHALHRDDGSAMCALWCDTDFHKGVALGDDDVLSMMQEQWPVEPGSMRRWCVLAGGEPLQQLDLDLIKALHAQQWLIAIETNGTVEGKYVPMLDHVCLSPKLGTDWQHYGTNVDEVRVVLPGSPPMVKGWSDEQLLEVEDWAFHKPVSGGTEPVALFVTPQDPVLPGPDFASWLMGGFEEDEAEVLAQLYRNAVQRCVKWVHAHPRWRLSLQVSKWLEQA